MFCTPFSIPFVSPSIELNDIRRSVSSLLNRLNGSRKAEIELVDDLVVNLEHLDNVDLVDFEIEILDEIDFDEFVLDNFDFID